MQNNETQRIADWMSRLAVDPSLRPLEDPDLLWVKAQLSERQAALERAFRPIVWLDAVARGLIGFAISWMALHWAQSFLGPAMGLLDPKWLSLAASLVVMAVIVIAYPILVDE